MAGRDSCRRMSDQEYMEYLRSMQERIVNGMGVPREQFGDMRGKVYRKPVVMFGHEVPPHLMEDVVDYEYNQKTEQYEIVSV